MVCGPTAGGKSGLADDLADALSSRLGRGVPTIVVDSVQVYAGLAKLSNQSRRRPAELVGVVPVTERWTMARHREAADAVTAATGPPFVLDAGTGMYLNALLLDIEISPQVPEAVRSRAQTDSAGSPNPRRSSRERELAMVGAAPRASIWSGEPRHQTSILYLRPDRTGLDRAIAQRSKGIAQDGLKEARALREMVNSGIDVNPSVLESIGVRELLAHLSGDATLAQAEERIAARTRQLARRQIRWFDKLARALEGRARVSVAGSPAEACALHTMHDTMGS